ncbi:MAG: hypothetical protein AB1411_02420 [Nitrospirota bacterium]
MTSGNPPFVACTIRGQGVTVRSPLALYEAATPNRIVLLSVYGSPQQTRAISALLATGQVLLADGPAGQLIELRRPEQLRIRGRAIGYGKQHLLLWDEQIRDTHVIWMSPDRKLASLQDALNLRTIPFDPAWLPAMDTLLTEGDYFEPLAGWGPAQGYRVRWDDAAICDALVKRFGQPQPTKAPRRKRTVEQAA